MTSVLVLGKRTQNLLQYEMHMKSMDVQAAPEVGFVVLHVCPFLTTGYCGTRMCG